MTQNVFITELAKKVNSTPEKLLKELEEAKQELASLHPNQSDETLNEKAKTLLKVKYRRSLSSSAATFEGIVAGWDEPRDLMKKLRDGQLKKYDEAREKANQTGDSSVLDVVFSSKVVEKGSDGKIYALYPKIKQDGSAYKKAGERIPLPQEAQVQHVWGICVKADQTDPHAFDLELKGEGCNPEFVSGKIVRFKAMDHTEKELAEDKKALWNLSSNKTEFVPCENAFLEEGVKRKGLPKLLMSMFPSRVVTWETLNSWIQAKKENPSDEPVPESLRQGFIMVPDSLCVRQNWVPNAKGKVNLNFCSHSEDILDGDMLAQAMSSMDKHIAFAQNSNALVLGRPWIMNPDERTGKVTAFMTLFGAHGYPDWTFPRVQAQKLSEKDLMQTTKPAPAKAPVPTKAVESEEGW